MKLKILLPVGILLFMTLGTVPMASFAAERTSPIEVEILKNGKETDVSFGEETGTPFIDSNDRTLVPLRTIAEALDLEVNWDAETKTAKLLSKTVEQTVSFTVGSNKYVFNAGEQFKTAEMDTEAVIISDRIYAPCRYLAEALGYNVFWDSDNNKIIVADEDIMNR